MAALDVSLNGSATWQRYMSSVTSQICFRRLPRLDVGINWLRGIFHGFVEIFFVFGCGCNPRMVAVKMSPSTASNIHACNHITNHRIVNKNMRQVAKLFVSSNRGPVDRHKTGISSHLWAESRASAGVLRKLGRIRCHAQHVCSQQWGAVFSETMNPITLLPGGMGQKSSRNSGQLYLPNVITPAFRPTLIVSLAANFPSSSAFDNGFSSSC